ncbi:AfsR/SARP family transcriptional regulator [Actinocrispum wychmicini]|uniref:DNA-binding SARP family transcriptional activator n=1 Tax=Actinocrispum wychmicini TaxID=1213861 RepID=A0A4R2JTU4_9PSEU|nr:AfsR/SARP family transcriptional regulator [Actinocrispum wychmicini]TCO60718.1 DNA-binding SARP family transcriptional activator [Actinocrispum wychmicini]
MEFQLLGPVEARGERGPVPLGGALSRSILAALLLQPNRAVPTKQLVDAAWGENPPAGARTLVQNRVSMLRRALREPRADGGLIATTGSGYLIHVEPEQLDVEQFTHRVARAGHLAESGERAAAVTELVGALTLWQGTALDGLTTPYLKAAAQRLEEQRLRAWERRIRLDISLGRHADLVAELTGLADTYSYHESFHALLMLVLYWTGRHADALAAYRRARATLSGQLGLEPSALLQHMHDAILRADTWVVQTIAEQLGCAPASAGMADPSRRITRLELDSGAPVPRTLPADDAAFAGRAEELAKLDETLTSSTPATIWTITGMAGVGKSALAVHWAHRVADWFPDGQLYLDLGGHAGRQLTPAEALDALLGALGSRPDRLPAAVEDLATHYRSAVAGRRLLVLLDNACSCDQIRQLLPGGPECVVLITSRDRLSPLVAREGAHRLSLELFRSEEAYALLARMLGEERVRAEPVAAHDLARACAYLPLALRIAATQLVDRPHRRIADQVARLANGNRLNALAIDGDGDVAVRSAFDLSYGSVPPDAQRLFRRLGQVPDPDLTAPVAAEIAGVAVPEAERLLDRLAAENLIYERDSGRYQLHELVRSYARERALGELP